MWKLLEKIILALAMSIKSEPEYDGIIRIDGNDKVLSGFADVHFEDGTTFKFGIEDFVREYLRDPGEKALDFSRGMNRPLYKA